MKNNIPRVFISYSHDTPEHKRWVADLASSLVKNGIDISFDQWDLGYGDDIPKFMEKSLTDSDRVIMICTENYTRKADDGKGGVGYEAMIVTSELVRDLGTSKFIPVVRQKAEEKTTPKSISTRLYVDFSEDDAFQASLEELLRELHNAPATTKPAIGKNPFLEEEIGHKQKFAPIEKSENDKRSIFSRALSIAKEGDILKWREIVRTSRKKSEDSLMTWRNENQTLPQTRDELIRSTISAANCYSDLICVALAGVASGQPDFRNQASLLEEILNPKDWSHNGYIVITKIPESIAFIYQALHGAMCAQIGQLRLAIDLARAKFEFPLINNPIPLWKYSGVIGWPESMGGHATEAWDALVGLIDQWPWMTEIFGEKEDYAAYLSAYYMALNINEYSNFVSEARNNQISDDNTLRLSVPICFTLCDKLVGRRAYRLLIQNQDYISYTWKSLNVGEKYISENWEKWINICRNWSSHVRGHWFNPYIPHERAIPEILASVPQKE